MTMFGSVLPTGRKARAAILVGAAVLAACEQQIVLTDEAVSADDGCSQFRVTIAEARETDIQRQAQGAGVGALFGAVIGAAVADSRGQNRTRGAIIGAGLGGLAGLSATYYQQLQERATDQATLLATVNSDAGRELGLITRTGQATQALRACRQQELRALAASVRSGATSAQEGRRQLARIKSRLQADNQVVSAAFNGIGQRVDAYVDATSQAGQVQTAIIRAERPPAQPVERQVRARAPSVTQAVTQTNAAVSRDQQTVNQINQEIDALEVLLG